MMHLEMHGQYQSDYLLEQQVIFAGIGMENLECVVLPPGKNNEAIPLEAIVKTMPH